MRHFVTYVDACRVDIQRDKNGDVYIWISEQKSNVDQHRLILHRHERVGPIEISVNDLLKEEIWVSKKK